MTTWVLIIYLYSGMGEFATGGPTTIDGFTSYSKCEMANQKIAKTLKKYDWGQCIEITK